MLMEHKGIGRKVANCISLFGLHHLDACPIDVWMKKIIDEEYGGIQPKWMSEGMLESISNMRFSIREVSR